MIVAGIHDDRKLLWRDNAAKSVHELSAASASGEYDDHAGLRA